MIILFIANILLVFAIGSCFGSFATFVSYRYFAEENQQNQELKQNFLSADSNYSRKNLINIVKSALTSRSICPNCHYQLKLINLIPILSWLYQKRKCANCKALISCRYPIIEIISSLLFIAVFIIFLFNNNITSTLIFDNNWLSYNSNIEKLIKINNWKLWQYWLLFWFALVIAIGDWEHFIIPKSWQVIFLLLILIIKITILEQSIAINHETIFYKIKSLVSSQKFIDSVLSAIAYPAFFATLGLLVSYFFAKPAIGIDDIRLLFAIGFFLPMQLIFVFTALSGFFGLITGLIFYLIEKKRMAKLDLDNNKDSNEIQENFVFPFAPALLFSMLLCWFLANYLLLQ
jgi:prepilin signal peptidase PulO-like enzyme (type II secretory pathway)